MKVGVYPLSIIDECLRSLHLFGISSQQVENDVGTGKAVQSHYLFLAASRNEGKLDVSFFESGMGRGHSRGGKM